MDAKQRIRELMAQRQWSEYRLAIASGLSQSTIANIFSRNTTPSIATLESICSAFGITLAQFFSDGEMVELTPEQREMFSAWSSLSTHQKEALSHLIQVMKNP
ncbi:MAG: helix-turn-helix domain-containing protein [Christensenellales bacterium]